MKKDRKTKIKLRSFISIFIGMLIILAITTQVYYAIQISSLGMSLTTYEKEDNLLKRELYNKILELSKKTSLLLLSDEAERLGYLNPVNIIYLKPEEGVAKAY